MQTVLGKGGSWSLFKYSPGFHLPSVNSEKELRAQSSLVLIPGRKVGKLGVNQE